MQLEFLKSQKKKINTDTPDLLPDQNWNDLIYKIFFDFQNIIQRLEKGEKMIWAAFNCIVNVALISCYPIRRWLNKVLRMVWLLEEHKF